MLVGLKSVVQGICLGGRKIALFPLTVLRKKTVIPQNEIQSILFLRHDRIGDMILSTAALKALRRGYPHAKITILASERNFEILKHNPIVDEILIYKGILWFIKTIRPRGYDLVIDPFVTYELKQALMTYLSGGKYRIGFEAAGREVFFNVRGPVAYPQKQMVDHLLDLAERSSGRRTSCVPEVFLGDQEIEWAHEALAEKEISASELTIGIHPGAHYPSQRWPAEMFGELARRILGQCKAKVVLLGSRDENVLLHDVKKVAGNAVSVFSGLKLRELMALINRCDLLICNNSGPLHIAAALKVPTVSMIGPTVTPLWLPYGKNNVVLNKRISCSPCNRAHCKDHECMESITADEVLDAVRSQIADIKSKQKGASTVQKRGWKHK
jgi:heptosyltransferase-2